MQGKDSGAPRGTRCQVNVSKKPLSFRLGVRMALLIIAVSLCITGTALFAGSGKYRQMQINANKLLGYELGRMAAILADQDDIIRYMKEVQRIYENAPSELRDVPADPEADYLYSVEGGAYEALYDGLLTEEYLTHQKELENAAKEINALYISIVLADNERGRIVYVMNGIADEAYGAYYCRPGYWLEQYDFYLNYLKAPEEDPEGIHLGYKSINGDDIFSSTVPFYDPDTHKVLGFVIVNRFWNDLNEERYQFLAGFMLIVGAVTLVLVLISEAVLNYAIMRPLRRLTEEQARMATELDVASNIQLSMLPDPEENGAQASEYAIHARLIPAKEVGGDFYDFFVIDEDHVAIVIADVVGKGVPASLFSMVAKTMLKMSALEGHSPGKVCTEVNNRLCENNKEAMFVTVWFGIYSIRERTIRYVNAGHDSAVIFSEGNWQFDTADSDMAFGIMDDLPYTEHTRTLKEGERMLLYTDGVVEAQAADSGAELYGEDRLLSRLNGDLEMAGDNLITAIYDDTNVFIGASPQFDDITMVLLEVRG